MLGMYETDEEVAALQALLDRSHAGSTDHLKAIIHDDRMLTATDLIALLTGMKVLSLATVTAGAKATPMLRGATTQASRRA